ncbi:uncharacterized protein METZ01_LOCUS29256 [marine metagenome]|uniref:Uncharacterized protein n=1 Tax=marine metagenome TaxID=408172 RepID=A0A381QAQ4_9ZZZZ
MTLNSLPKLFFKLCLSKEIIGLDLMKFCIKVPLSFFELLVIGFVTFNHSIKEFFVFSEDRIIFSDAIKSSLITLILLNSIISLKTLLLVENKAHPFNDLLNLILLCFFKPISSIILAAWK